MENLTGYIYIHREILEHWIWTNNKPYSKCEAWIYLLLMASHSGEKFPFDGGYYTPVIGEIVTSEIKLMKKWKWSKTKVRAFLKKIQNELMIEIKSDKKKTCIIICNYKKYQNKETTKKPQKNHGETTEKPQKDTYNNVNNVNNEKNELVERHTLQKFVLENYPIVSKLKTQLTYQDCVRLEKDFTKAEIKNILDAMENYKKLLTNYNSVNLTIRKWIKLENERNKNGKTVYQKKHELTMQDIISGINENPDFQ